MGSHPHHRVGFLHAVVAQQRGHILPVHKFLKAVR